MKRSYTYLKGLLTLALAALTGGLWAEVVYNNAFAGSDTITLNGDEFGATATTALTQIPENDTVGNLDKVIAKSGGDNDTRTHTFSMWVKVPTLADDQILWWVSGGHDGEHSGYAVKVMANGAIRVGKANGSGSWNGTNYLTTTETGLLQAGEWAYVTVAVTKTSDARTATPKVYVNAKPATISGTFPTNLNGNGGSATYAKLGANISAAMISVEDVALDDAGVMASYLMCYKTLPAATWTWDGNGGTVTQDTVGQGVPVYTVSTKVVDLSTYNIPAKNFTYSFWTKRSISDWRDYVGFADSANRVALEQGRHNKAWFYGVMAGAITEGVDYGIALSADAFQMVTIVVNNGVVTTYIDGSLASMAAEQHETLQEDTYTSVTIPESKWASLYSDSATMTYFGLGCSPTTSGGYDRETTAQIADAKVYNTALTAEQVRLEYYNTLTSLPKTYTATVTEDVDFADIVWNEGSLEVSSSNSAEVTIADAKTLTFSEAPGVPVKIKNAQVTDVSSINLTATAPSAIRAILNKIDLTTSVGLIRVTIAAYTDEAAWWAYEFDGNGNNAGVDKTGLSWDGDRPFAADEFTVANEGETNRQLKLPARPWRNVSSYPSAFTAVMYAKAGSTANGVLASFGSTYQGGNKTITLAVGANPANGDMRLAYADAKNTPIELVENFSVPNSQTSNHLYVFSMYTLADGSHIDIYVDGEKLTTYTSKTPMSVGTGFQIASVHGGCPNTLERLANDDAATMDFLRVYDYLLSEETIKAMAEDYPYTSPSGDATRTLDGTACNWVESDDPAVAWTQNTLNDDASTTTTTQNAPNAGTNVVLNASVPTIMTVNLPEGTTAYETLTINGDVTFVAAEGSAKLAVSGRTTINGNVTMPHDLVSLSTVTVKSGKTLTIDASSLNLAKIYTSETIQLTGLIDKEDDTAKVEIDISKIATADGRTLTVEEKEYGWSLKVEFTGTLTATVPADGAEWTNLPWFLGSYQLAADEVPPSFEGIPVRLTAEEGATLTLTDNLKVAALEVAGDKTLKVAGAYTLTVPVEKLTTTAALSLDAATTLDLTDATLDAITKAIEGEGTVKVKLTNTYGNEVNFANFAGTTYVTAGYLSVDKGNVGATLKLANGSNVQTTKTTTDATLNIVLEGDTQFHVNSGYPYATTGTINGGKLIVKGSSELKVAGVTSNVQLDNALTIAATGETTLSGQFSGNAALKIAFGTVTMTAANGNYGGTITVDTGATLASGLTHALPFGGNSATIVNNGTVVISQGTLPTLTGAGNVTIADADCTIKSINTTGTVTLSANVALALPEGAGAGTEIITCANAAEIDLAKLPAAPEGLRYAVDGNTVKLAKAGAFTVNGETYESFADAFANVAEGGTITIDETVVETAFETSGFVIEKSMTINLGGKTLTLTPPAVGSTGTQTLGIQILKSAESVVIKNGTINVADTNLTAEKPIKMLINNYASYSLTLEGVTLDGTNLVKPDNMAAYTLSNNQGFVAIVSSTIIAKAEGGIAFDACKYANYEAPSVIVDEDSTITGSVELSGGSVTAVEGAISVVSGIAGYKVDYNGTTYTLVKKGAFEVNGTDYATLAEAYAAGDTITLTADAEGPGLIINKAVTIDFGGHTYTLTDGVGNVPSNGLQLLKEAGDVTLKNGTLKVADAAKAKFYILVQNYTNLTVTDMVLDGTNLDKWSGTDGDSYTLSINSGTVTINGKTTIIANNDGDLAYAFDSCKYQNYDAPAVTVADTVTVDGKVELSGGALTAPAGLTVTTSAGYKVGYADGEYTMVKKGAFEVNGTDYATLAEAYADAQAGDTITLTADAESEGIKIQKSVTINLGGKTLTLTPPAVGSTGTQTLGIQILKGTTVAINNGTINVAASNLTAEKPIKMMINNYSTALTLTGVTLDGTNLYKGTALVYTLSNNSGSVTIGEGTTIKAKTADDIALDACQYASYTAPTVTIAEGATIEGKVEVTGGTVVAAEGLDVITLEGYKVVYADGKYTMVLNVVLDDVIAATPAAEAIKAAMADAGVTEIETYTIFTKDADADADADAVANILTVFDVPLAVEDGELVVAYEFGISSVTNEGEVITITASVDEETTIRAGVTVVFTVGEATYTATSTDGKKATITGLQAGDISGKKITVKATK